MTAPTAGQSRLSTYFSPTKSSGKRASSPLDLTLDDEQPPAKKAKVSTTGTSTKQVSNKAATTKKPLKSNPVTVDTDSDSDPEFKKLLKAFSKKPAAKGKGKAKTTKEIDKYTPLEKQFIQLKKDNPDTVLMIEVGYKYIFFEEDAKVAEKELGMYPFHKDDRQLLEASVPAHRLDIHLRKLLSQGYRVGVVKQTETAALKKAGDNRSGPFERKLQHLYTAATFVDGLDSLDDVQYTAPPFMCLIETAKKDKTSGNIQMAFVSICPSTGDVLVWDQFEDTPMRLEFEARLAHIRPTEVLFHQGGVSKPTRKMLGTFSGAPTSAHQIRTESFQDIMTHDEAFDLITTFYTKSPNSGELLATVIGFPKSVLVALAHAIRYLSAFDLADAFLDAKSFSRFTDKTHMLLKANTLANLEIYQNQTDYTTRGSLLSILDRTSTKFGARLLRQWVGKPLVDRCALEERIDAVQEIMDSSSEKLNTLYDVLRRLPDLSKGICRIQYGQCTPQELALLLPAFDKIANAYDVTEPSEVGFKSRLLNEIIASLPSIREPSKELLSIVSLKQAAAGDKVTMWKDPERYPMVEQTQMVILTIEAELEHELKSIRRALRMPSLQWTHTQETYVIELKRADNRPIPPEWDLISSTKKVARYRSPVIKQKLQERAQRQESLNAYAKQAYISFLKEISEQHLEALRNVVNKLARADCLISLARVAQQNNYVRPAIVDGNSLEIVDGRHPMAEILRNDPFVPNSLKMEETKGRHLIITGPNMGGKSSVVRMVALLQIMAQVGSYIPASSATFGLVTSVLTRMGASDDIARGRSTFMVEITETSEILKTCCPRSLVILDELGRGTSSFDGMAIAHAVLDHLAGTVKCKTLFITHYPMIAIESEKNRPDEVANVHMGYASDTRVDGRREISFLYKLEPGIALESFGIECGRLAQVPETILEAAATRSRAMEAEVTKRIKANSLKRLLTVCLANKDQEKTKAALQELKRCGLR
ncbi:muts domain V-domain-containing protein [Mycena floridula]|nr:muts domain V-domain-containing protein [Mycena floridula]